MKTPKYSDGRYQHPYRKAAETDVSVTFRRVRAEHKAKAEEAEINAAEVLDKVVHVTRKRTGS